MNNKSENRNVRLVFAIAETIMLAIFTAGLIFVNLYKTVSAEENNSDIITTEDIQKFDTFFTDQETPEANYSDQPMGNGLDASEMIYIPAGSFTMGASEENIQAMFWDKPEHEVVLDAFWIDKYEVTNDQFSKCVATGYCVQPRSLSSKSQTEYYGNANFANYPVIYIDWNQASYYCNWVGKRLPTEAEWEKAARGTDSRIYPWGNDGDPAGLMNVGHLQEGDTEKVGSYPDGASPYGVLDMGGNVWEWTADLFDKDYYTYSPTENPAGSSEGQIHSVRGLSWAYVFPNKFITTRNKADAYAYTYDLGFRCALSAPEE